MGCNKSSDWLCKKKVPVHFFVRSYFTESTVQHREFSWFKFSCPATGFVRLDECDVQKLNAELLTVFCDIAPCSLVIDRLYRGAYFLRPVDGGSKLLRNASEFVPEYTAQYPRKRAIFILATVRTWYLTRKVIDCFQGTDLWRLTFQHGLDIVGPVHRNELHVCSDWRRGQRLTYVVCGQQSANCWFRLLREWKIARCIQNTV
jgi:hypothetical protein